MAEKVTPFSFVGQVKSLKHYTECYNTLVEIVSQFLKFVMSPNIILEKECNSDPKTESEIFDEKVFRNKFFQITALGSQEVISVTQFELIISPIFEPDSDSDEEDPEREENICVGMVALKNWVKEQSKEFSEYRENRIYNIEDVIHIVYQLNTAVTIRVFPKYSYHYAKSLRC